MLVFLVKKLSFLFVFVGVMFSVLFPSLVAIRVYGLLDSLVAIREI